MNKVTLKVEIDEETYKQIKGDSVYDNNNKIIISKSSSAYYALNAIINATPLIECDDAISRQAVLNEVREIATWHSGDAFNEDRVIRHMKMLPSVNPTRERGEWLKTETSYAVGVRQYCRCSQCGLQSLRPLGNFCRWCGADMRGEE